MIDFYPQVKAVHVAAVLASGALFCLRGGAVLAGRQWAMRPALRHLSYSIDTVLLAAALVLLAMLPPAAMANGWLITKVALLFVYIGLGSFALKRGRTPRIRSHCFVAAVVVFAAMLAVARFHHPLGPWLALRYWLG